MTNRPTEHHGSTVCYRHSDRATRLSCSNCGRPICAECSIDASVGQRCPECAKPTGRHRVVDARRTVLARPSFQTAPVSFTVIAICAALFVLAFATERTDFDIVKMLGLGSNDTDIVARTSDGIGIYIGAGEWWRVFTAAFLHLEIWHIFFNMYALYIFGPRLEMQVGSVPFGLMYLASAAGGGAASYIFAPPGQVSVGASGAIFGLFGAWVFASYLMRGTPAGRSQFNQLLILLAINAAIPLIIPNIDWRAHVGGFLVGVFIAWLWKQFAVGKPNVIMMRTITAGATLAALLVVVIVA